MSREVPQIVEKAQLFQVIPGSRRQQPICVAI